MAIYFISRLVNQLQINLMMNNGEEEHQLMITQLKDSQTMSITTSQYCVSQILKELVDISWDQFQIGQLFSKFLPAYSNLKMMGNIQEVNNFIFNPYPWVDKIGKQEQEPTPLNIDSLLPISAEIDAENLYKKNNNKKIVTEEDSLTRSKARDREDSIERRQKYTKLQMTEISEEDGFTKELRKINEEKNNKVQNERKIQEKKLQQRLEKLKQKDKKKNEGEERFSYDYNGEVVEIRMESKANLVSKVINGLTNQNAKIMKQAFNDPNPAEVDASNSKKDRKLALLMYSKRKDDVQFSEVKSLADNYQTRAGVKYTYEGKTYEEKPKVATAAELRKTLSQRKITKEDYKRIKDLNGNKNDYEEILKQSRTKEAGKPQKSHSDAKYAESRLSSRRKEKIHVTNYDLKGKLLEKVPQYVQQEQPIQSLQNQTQRISRLGNIDSFNLQYLRTGGTLHANTSKDFFSQRNNELPKITHTTLYSKMLPKGRERIKDANEIIRDLRKKFQEKLRV